MAPYRSTAEAGYDVRLTVLRQGNEIVLEAIDFGVLAELGVSLKQVCTAAQQDASGGNRAEVAFVKPMPYLQHVPHALGFSQEFAGIEGVDVNFIPHGLESTEKMSRKRDSHHGQSQPPGNEQIDKAHAQRVASSAVQDAIQIAVLRVKKAQLVPRKSQFLVEMKIDDVEYIFCRAIEVQTQPQFGDNRIEQRGVAVQIDLRVLGFAEQQTASLQIELFAVIEAEGKKFPVRSGATKVFDNPASPTAQDRVIADGAALNPFAGDRPVGNQLLPNYLINSRIIIRQQADERLFLALSRLGE